MTPPCDLLHPLRRGSHYKAGVCAIHPACPEADETTNRPELRKHQVMDQIEMFHSREATTGSLIMPSPSAESPPSPPHWPLSLRLFMKTTTKSSRAFWHSETFSTSGFVYPDGRDTLFAKTQFRSFSYKMPCHHTKTPDPHERYAYPRYFSSYHKDILDIFLLTIQILGVLVIKDILSRRPKRVNNNAFLRFFFGFYLDAMGSEEVEAWGGNRNCNSFACQNCKMEILNSEYQNFRNIRTSFPLPFFGSSTAHLLKITQIHFLTFLRVKNRPPSRILSFPTAQFLLLRSPCFPFFKSIFASILNHCRR
jgi:hypothetical protein